MPITDSPCDDFVTETGDKRAMNNEKEVVVMGGKRNVRPAVIGAGEQECTRTARIFLVFRSVWRGLWGEVCVPHSLIEPDRLGRCGNVKRVGTSFRLQLPAVRSFPFVVYLSTLPIESLRYQSS